LSPLPFHLALALALALLSNSPFFTPFQLLQPLLLLITLPRFFQIQIRFVPFV
jgi:hypothetical protein